MRKQIRSTVERVTHGEMMRVVNRVRALARGRKNAWPAKQLGDDLGYAAKDVRDGRLLRLLAAEAVGQGFPLCTDNAGYFWPTSAGEADEAIRRLRSAGKALLRRADALQEAVEAEFGSKSSSLQ
jgi:hypothetical protein